MQDVSAATDETMGELVTVTQAEVPKANISSEPDPSKAVGSGREQREGNRFKSLNRSFPIFSVTKASVPGKAPAVGQFSNYTGTGDRDVSHSADGRAVLNDGTAAP